MQKVTERQPTAPIGQCPLWYEVPCLTIWSKKAAVDTRESSSSVLSYGNRPHPLELMITILDMLALDTSSRLSTSKQ